MVCQPITTDALLCVRPIKGNISQFSHRQLEQLNCASIIDIFSTAEVENVLKSHFDWIGYMKSRN